MSDQIQLSDAVHEWEAIKDNLKALRTRVKEMNVREKALKEVIKKSMVSKEIDVINLKSGGKVSKKTTKKRSPFNSKLVKDVLMDYHDNNESVVDRIMNLIESKREITESTSVSMTKK